MWTVGADSTDQSSLAPRAASGAPVFNALIELGSQNRQPDDFRLPLAAGTQVSAEIVQGRRTVVEYLLSRVQRAANEAGMER